MTPDKRTITNPAEWWAAFEAQAKAEQTTLSEWVGKAAVAKLPKEVRAKLPERRPAHRPRKEG